MLDLEIVIILTAVSSNFFLTLFPPIKPSLYITTAGERLNHVLEVIRNKIFSSNTALTARQERSTSE